ncbi:MAG: 50S ribosomal protein L18 [Limnobacter sp.]|nr:50S ribosomal protein L18 [Limnobacter sp.]
METKNQARLRRAQQTRRRIALAASHRLTVYRSNQHIYAAVQSADGSKVFVAASTVDSVVKGQLAGKSGSDKEAAKLVGSEVARRAIAAGIETVAFDRGGYAYQGRVKELAESAREAGLKF